MLAGAQPLQHPCWCHKWVWGLKKSLQLSDANCQPLWGHYPPWWVSPLLWALVLQPMPSAVQPSSALHPARQSSPRQRFDDSEIFRVSWRARRFFLKFWGLALVPTRGVDLRDHHWMITVHGGHVGHVGHVEMSSHARMQTLWQMPHFYALAWMGT